MRKANTLVTAILVLTLAIASLLSGCSPVSTANYVEKGEGR